LREPRSHAVFLLRLIAPWLVCTLLSGIVSIVPHSPTPVRPSITAAASLYHLASNRPHGTRIRHPSRAILLHEKHDIFPTIKNMDIRSRPLGSSASVLGSMFGCLDLRIRQEQNSKPFRTTATPVASNNREARRATSGGAGLMSWENAVGESPCFINCLRMRLPRTLSRWCARAGTMGKYAFRAFDITHMRAFLLQVLSFVNVRSPRTSRAGNADLETSRRSLTSNRR